MAAAMSLYGANALCHLGVSDGNGAQPQALGVPDDGSDVPRACHGDDLT